MAKKKDLQFLQNRLEHFNQENAVLNAALVKWWTIMQKIIFCKWQNILLKKLVKEFHEFSGLIYESPKGPLLPEKINENRDSLSKAISNFEKRFEVLSNVIKTKVFYTI